MIEQWRDIQDYEGLYQISNLGRVKSCERICKTGNGLGEHLLPEKLLKLSLVKGYLQIALHKEGKYKYYKVHRLVAQTFIPNPDNKEQVNHIDGNKQNNCIDNLEWVTGKENMLHASKNGLLKGNTKTHYQNKTNGQKSSKPIIAINLKTNEEIYFKSQNEASRQLNLCKSDISAICKGKIKQTKGYTFRRP